MPAPGMQPSMVQASPSAQLRRTPGVHAPLLQMSFKVQRLPSSQPGPLRKMKLQKPVWLWQPSEVQGLPSVQTTGVPVQPVLWQVSPDVHRLPSLHTPPVPK